MNNAGAGAILPLADATADRIMKIFAVNVLGPGLLAAAALPYLAVVATAGGLMPNHGVPSDAMVPNAVVAVGCFVFVQTVTQKHHRANEAHSESREILHLELYGALF